MQLVACCQSQMVAWMRFQSSTSSLIHRRRVQMLNLDLSSFVCVRQKTSFVGSRAVFPYVHHLAIYRDNLDVLDIGEFYAHLDGRSGTARQVDWCACLEWKDS
jgi:hypothetical protein